MRATLAHLRRLGPFGVLLGASAALPLVGSALLFARADSLEAWFRDAGAFEHATFVLATAGLCSLALLNTQFAALFAGYVFGFGSGLAASLAGIALAAFLGYEIALRISGPRLVEAIQRSPRASAVHEALVSDARGARTTAALLRISPIVPFATVNVLLAATRVRALDAFVGSFVGIVPRTALVAFAGSQLADFDPSAGPEARWQLAFAIGGTLLLFAWIGFAGRRALRRRLKAPSLARE